MTLQLSTTLRTNEVATIQTTVAAAGSTAHLNIYTGAEPLSCAAAESGTLLVSIPLPTTFLTSSGGVAALTGTWSAAAAASGTAGHFRILDSAGVVHVQGDCTSDLILQNNSIATGQTVSVTTFNVTAANG